ncbi:MAG: hypothetical protein HYY15_03510 [Candidatus Omnitrophica bacterium]|nr:hypothetical protein [Candidatus Omnitrophota bacterium]
MKLPSSIPLETFDPTAFIADESIPQEVCNFVLALALAYNDIKDVTEVHLRLKEQRPLGVFQKRVDFGMHGGRTVHLIRYQIGLVHELCELIRNNERIISHPLLQAIISQMPKKSRIAWQSLVDTATGKLRVGPLAQAVIRIRQKVVFHYDTEEIFNGYKRHFLNGAVAKELAYISRGSTMAESRFYFADAAAESYLSARADQRQATELAQSIIGAMKDANFAIRHLVNGFIQKRFGYTLVS